MRKPVLFVLALGWLVGAGLHCGGCNSNPKPDGGSPDGGGPGDGGPDGGGPGDGGIITGGVDPGGWTIDGGGGGGSGGVAVGPDGGLVLDTRSIDLHFAWIANSGEGWVSKFDTRSGKEVGRYFTVIPKDGQGNPQLSLRYDYLGGNSPSRTAIDLFGNVWIANRAPGLQGSVTKIANDLSDCNHSLPDGGVRTSRDLNNDGQIDTSPAAGEFITPSDPINPATYDDCVLFSTPVGSGPGGGVKVRALAISQGAFETGSAGDIWAGVYSDRKFFKLNSADGRIMPLYPDGGTSVTVSFGGTDGPYGAAVDRQQRLWTLPPGVAQLALIDTRTGTLVTDQILPTAPVTTAGAYGIAIDGRDRVWLPGYGVGPYAYRYDHGPGLDAGTGTWTAFDFTAARSQTGSRFGEGRGIAVDDQGYVWMSGWYENVSAAAVAQLIGFSAEDGGVKKFGTADFIDATDSQSNTSIGVGVDSDNNIWVNNYSGNAMKIYRADGGVFKTPQQPGNLYTYSDFTGYQLRHFTAPFGFYRRDFEGCGPGATRWLSVTWDGYTPPNTAIKLLVRAADDPAALGTAQSYGPFTQSPADLLQPPGPVPSKGYLRVEFQLTSTDGASTPVLNSFQVSWRCILG